MENAGIVCSIRGNSASHPNILASIVAKKINVYSSNMTMEADGKYVHQMKAMKIRMTSDMIARIVLDNNSHYQVRDNSLAAVLRSCCN